MGSLIILSSCAPLALVSTACNVMSERFNYAITKEMEKEMRTMRA